MRLDSHLICGMVLCCLFSVLAPGASARPIAEDLLTYPPGLNCGPYAGNSEEPISHAMLNGGSGWKSPWTQWYGFRENDARIYLETGGLDAAFPQGYDAKGEVRLQVYHASFGRELAKPAGGKGSTVWIGFAFQSASVINGNDNPVGLGFQLLQGGIKGKPVFSLIRKANCPWGISTADPATNNTGWNEDQKPHYYLIKIVDDGTEATVWANRYSSADTVISEPTTWQVNGVKVPSFQFDTVYIKGNKPGYDAGASPVWFDEVRLATSFGDFPFSQAVIDRKAKEAAEREAARIRLEALIKERMKTAWLPGSVPMPEGSKIANVVAFGAARDGKTDDTEAINKAFATTQTVYFPPGTYLVSGTLRVGTTQCQHRLIGAGRDVTIIKLKDGTFANKDAPQAVVAFNLDYPNVSGTTGMAFSNYLTDVTIDIGANNAGATAVAYITNNDGAIRDVIIKSSAQDFAGFCGIDMRKGWCGPGIIKNVQIIGFDSAISYAYREYSMTLESLKISNQRVAGIVNHENILCIRDLSSNNRVPVIRNETPRAVTVIVDSTFEGNSSQPAILNGGGYVFARNVKAPGYASAVQGMSEKTAVEYSSSQGATAPKTLNLPVKDHRIEPLPLDQWVSVSDYGAVSDDKTDDGPAIQKAIDAAAAAGKKKIYFPRGGSSQWDANHYMLNSKVRVHGSVQEVDFVFSPVQIGGDGGFVVEDGPAPVVTFQRAGQIWGGGGFMVIHKSNRALHLRDFPHSNIQTYRNEGSTGDVYMENIASVNVGPMGPFVKGQNVWGRSVNDEFSGTHLINKGATLWILGFKTEQNGINCLTEDAGKTEILGGFIYPVKASFTALPGDFPSFKAVGSVQCLVGLGSNSNAGNNIVPVEEQRGGKMDSIPAARFNSAGYPGAEWLIPVYVSPTLP